jgi:midasin (ATPase involved in ribosome maturation)
MKIQAVRSTLDYILPKTGVQLITPMLYGFPGVGKSSIIAEIAEERGLQLVDLRISQHDNTDFKFPVIGDSTVRWITADFLPVEGNPRFEGTSGILFLDEINLATPDVLNSVFQLIYDRRVGDNKILDTWHIVAAGNLGYEDGNDSVVEFSTALRDRLLPIVVDQFNLDEWQAHVTNNGCAALVVDYVKANPTKLYIESKWRDDKVFITPRRWEKLGLLMARTKEENIIDLLKHVGEGFLYGEVAEFLEYVVEVLNSKKKVDVKDLFQNYSKYEKTISAMDRDRIFQLNSRITKYLITETFQVTDCMVDNFSKYVKSLSDDLKISFIRSIKKEGVAMHGKDAMNTTSAASLLKTFFEKDAEFAEYVASIIKKGVGFTQPA